MPKLLCLCEFFLGQLQPPTRGGGRLHPQGVVSIQGWYRGRGGVRVSAQQMVPHNEAFGKIIISGTLCGGGMAGKLILRSKKSKYSFLKSPTLKKYFYLKPKLFASFLNFWGLSNDHFIWKMQIPNGWKNKKKFGFHFLQSNLKAGDKMQQS